MIYKGIKDLNIKDLQENLTSFKICDIMYIRIKPDYIRIIKNEWDNIILYKDDYYWSDWSEFIRQIKHIFKQDNKEG